MLGWPPFASHGFARGVNDHVDKATLATRNTGSRGSDGTGGRYP